MKTLFIDFGNVIGFFDHGRAVARLTAHTPLTPAELRKVLYDGDAEDAYERGALSSAEYFAAIRGPAGLTCDEATFFAAFADIFTPNPAVCGRIPVWAESARLVLASNTNDAHFRHYCGQFAGEMRHFHHLGTSHRAGVRKPHAGFFEYCQQFASGPPSACVFLDDLPGNVAAAREFGWDGILYTPGTDLDAELAARGIPAGRVGS